MKKLLLTGALALSLFACQTYEDEYNDALINIKTLEAELLTAQSTIFDLRSATDNDAATIASLTEQITNMEGIIATLRDANAIQESDIANYLAQLEQLRSELDAANTELDALVVTLNSSDNSDVLEVNAELNEQVIALEEEIARLQSQEEIVFTQVVNEVLLGENIPETLLDLVEADDIEGFEAAVIELQNELVRLDMIVDVAGEFLFESWEDSASPPVELFQAQIEELVLNITRSQENEQAVLDVINAVKDALGTYSATEEELLDAIHALQDDSADLIDALDNIDALTAENENLQQQLNEASGAWDELIESFVFDEANDRYDSALYPTLYIDVSGFYWRVRNVDDGSLITNTNGDDLEGLSFGLSDEETLNAAVSALITSGFVVIEVETVTEVQTLTVTNTVTLVEFVTVTETVTNTITEVVTNTVWINVPVLYTPEDADPIVTEFAAFNFGSSYRWQGGERFINLDYLDDGGNKLPDSGFSIIAPSGSQIAIGGSTGNGWTVHLGNLQRRADGGSGVYTFVYDDGTNRVELEIDIQPVFAATGTTDSNPGGTGGFFTAGSGFDTSVVPIGARVDLVESWTAGQNVVNPHVAAVDGQRLTLEAGSWNLPGAADGQTTTLTIW